MNTYRAPIIVVLLIVFLVGAWFFYYTNRTQPIVEQTLHEQFSWQLQTAPQSATSTGPQTQVNLKVAGVPVSVGTYDGTCDDPSSLLPGEITGLVCTTGTGGTEVGVFRVNGTLTLEDGAIDPATGRGAGFAPIVQGQ